jgi:hypothetical protein
MWGGGLAGLATGSLPAAYHSGGVEQYWDSGYEKKFPLRGIQFRYSVWRRGILALRRARAPSCAQLSEADYKL